MTNVFDLHKIMESASKITLPGGVVGKVCKVLIFVAVAFAAIAWSVKVVWVSVVALCLLFCLCLPILWRLLTFADRNPQAAILEGAEFLVHEQLRLGTKETPQLPSANDQYIEATPVELTPDELESAQEPDQDLPQLSENNDGEEVDHG